MRWVVVVNVVVSPMPRFLTGALKGILKGLTALGTGFGVRKQVDAGTCFPGWPIASDQHARITLRSLEDTHVVVDRPHALSPMTPSVYSR